MVTSDFSSKTIFLDTAPLIYFIEGNSEYQEVLSTLFQLNDEGSFSFITSAITLIEVMVKPLKEGKIEVAKQYKDILTTAPGIEVFDVTSSISMVAAQLRADFNIKTPDAIQLATAIEGGADYFLTNDNKLKTIGKIEVVMLNELK